MKARILIVDDEEIVLRSCARILAGDAYEVETVLDPWEALRRVDENGYDVLVLDIMMPHIDGLQVLQHVKERHPDLDVIMMTGLSQIQTAVKAMKLGAFTTCPSPSIPTSSRWWWTARWSGSGCCARTARSSPRRARNTASRT
jgi:DNA-binding NtrC family response regulator